MIATLAWSLALLGLLSTGGLWLRRRLRAPARRYEGPASVADVYDGWTDNGVTEMMWGEHLHAGHYGDPVVAKDFVAAKVDFVDELVRWGVAEGSPALAERLAGTGGEGARESVKVLDAGCGIGGTARHVARRWPDTARVTGISLSGRQVQRAAALAREQGVDNAEFLLCDALATPFDDASFDVVLAVESEMYMPDKDRFVREMARVLRPGGMLVIAAWNVRDTRARPLSPAERDHLRLLVDEWCHASFTCVREYVEILERAGLRGVAVQDWTASTQPSWRHAVAVGLRNSPRMLGIGLKLRWSLLRDAHTTLRFHAAFRDGLCEYCVLRAQKAG